MERRVFLLCPLHSASCSWSREMQEHLKAKSSSSNNRRAFRLQRTSGRVGMWADELWKSGWFIRRGKACWGSVAHHGAWVTGWKKVGEPLNWYGAGSMALGIFFVYCSVELLLLKVQGKAVSKDFYLAALHEIFLSLHFNAWQLSFYKFSEPLIRAVFREGFAMYIWELVWHWFKLKAKPYFWGCFGPLSVKHGAVYYCSKNL